MPAPHSQPFSACAPFCSFPLLTLDRKSYAKGPFLGDVHITVKKMCFIQSPPLTSCVTVDKFLGTSKEAQFLPL